MTYEQAVRLIGAQEREIRKVNGLRMVVDNYEYRLTFGGGFSVYVGIDRREIGKRVFKYFSGFSARDCLSVWQVVDRAKGLIERKCAK